jgi:hypothetical protein
MPSPELTKDEREEEIEKHKNLMKRHAAAIAEADDILNTIESLAPAAIRIAEQHACNADPLYWILRHLRKSRRDIPPDMPGDTFWEEVRTNKSAAGLLITKLRLKLTQSYTPITLYYHGERSYSTDGQTPTKMTLEQHKFLKAFLDRDIALETKELEKEGISNVSKVAGKINERFRASVKLPEGRGAGYYARVRSMTPTG